MNRSGFFQKIALGAIGAAVLNKQAYSAFMDTESISELLYIGTYTATNQDGIPIGRVNPVNADIQLTDICRGVSNPSFLIHDRKLKLVYAANETDDFGGRKSGAVSAFRKDEKTGKLTFLNTVSSGGAHPCHLAIDGTGAFILVANYTGGSVAVLPIQADGSMGEAVNLVQHSGKGPDAGRQEAAHAHSVNLSPDNRFAFVCDLGMDKIMVYRFDEKTGKLSSANTPFFQTAPGAGPRHFTFSKDGSTAFVVNELNSTLTALKYDPVNGCLSEIQTLSTLPASFVGENTCADIHIHPNGRFVYASNRGDDSIAVFSTDPQGKMKLVQHQPTLGKTPRNFAIHSSGRLLLAANQNSDSVHAFSVDPATGKLAATGKSIAVDKPVCLLFSL